MSLCVFISLRVTKHSLTVFSTTHFTLFKVGLLSRNEYASVSVSLRSVLYKAISANKPPLKKEGKDTLQETNGGMCVCI